MKRRPPVRTKYDFVRRYRQGEFGNASPTWDTIEEFEAGAYVGLVHLRNRVAGGRTYYDVHSCDVSTRYATALREGVKPDDIYFSAMAPTDLTVFQGEVREDRDHLSLTYSLLAKTMREALSLDCRYATLTEALVLLRHFMCPNSFDWLRHLLDTYDGHTVEFSVYSRDWGTVPRFNTVFWEVRKY